MPEQTFIEKILQELNNAFPCEDGDCDRAGNIPVQDRDGDWVAQQCQYCFEVRFPVIERLERILSQALQEQRKELIEEIKQATNSKGMDFKACGCIKEINQILNSLSK